MWPNETNKAVKVIIDNLVNNSDITSIVNSVKNITAQLESPESGTDVEALKKQLKSTMVDLSKKCLYYIFTRDGNILEGELMPYYSINAFLNQYSNIEGHQGNKQVNNTPQNNNQSNTNGGTKISPKQKTAVDDFIRNNGII